MKKLILFLFIGMFATAFSSCIVLSTKKYKSLLSRQDSLSTGWTESQQMNEKLEDLITRLKKDTTGLSTALNDLKSRYSEMDDNYTKLRSNSSSEINKLSSDLKKREQRLKEVEEILRKRDEATNQLKEKLQQALLGFQQNGLTVDIRNGKVYVSLTDKLLFPSGSIVIDEKGKAALKQLAAVLQKEPDINMSVEGHTDNKKIINLGQIKDNWDLSVLRATSVTRYLIDVEKIAPKRLTATGKSEFQPIDNANTPEALSRNRRIEIVLSPKLDELYNLITK